MKKEKNNLRAVMGLCSLLCLASCGKEEKAEMYLGYYPRANAISISSFDDADGTIYGGTISYDNLEKGAIKIVTLKQGDITYEPKLMVIYQNEVRGMRSSTSYSELYYIDLKTGVGLIKYYWDDFSTEPTLERGESLEIVEEENLFNYVFQSGWFEEAYPIDELIAFYNEKVRENTESKELELTY